LYGRSIDNPSGRERLQPHFFKDELVEAKGERRICGVRLQRYELHEAFEVTGYMFSMRAAGVEGVRSCPLKESPTAPLCV
jgi:hypothetical protein